MNAVMLQGTGSNVGKSVLAAGICRALTNRGLTVRPFKAQNMSNNAAPAFGGEIGRAQALQALACRVRPTTDMNPILLKPQSDCTSQMIVNGKPCGLLQAETFRTDRSALLALALEAYRRLTKECDIVIAEGAGSPAETNLRAWDIVNMGFARAAEMPVVLVGDISRGGVIASLVGTKATLDPMDSALIKGFIINLFRGDIRLFDEGLRAIKDMTGWYSLGVVPWLAVARNLPAEDALRPADNANGDVTIAVPILPHLANFDDFDALEVEPSVSLTYVRPGEPIPAQAKMVILPGSKTTIADLAFFREQGWDIDLAAHIRRGGYVFGICGGYQMLGQSIADPMGIEGEPQETHGLGLLPIRTVLTHEKQIAEVSGVSLPDNIAFQGYEIHCGETRLEPDATPLFLLKDGRADGATSYDGLVFGCYIHRLFDHPKQRAKWLNLLHTGSNGISQSQRTEEALDQLAAELETYLEINEILKIAKR